MRLNRVKRTLREGGTAIGTMITEFRSPEVARIMAAAGFDFIIIDTEHSAYNPETVTDIIRAGKAMDLVCMVRVTDADYHLIARTLDIGAQGLLIPRVQGREAVERIVSYTKYPPWGVRGYGPRSIITDFEKKSVKELVEELNEETMVILQVESREAVEDIENLVTVKGVDAALIGPNDLSISLGVPGELEGPVETEVIQKVAEACRRHNVASGIHVASMENLLYWKRRGMRLLMYSSDASLILTAAREAVNTLRKEE